MNSTQILDIIAVGICAIIAAVALIGIIICGATHQWLTVVGCIAIITACGHDYIDEMKKTNK